jgi:hypothetical protein
MEAAAGADAVAVGRRGWKGYSRDRKMIVRLSFEAVTCRAKRRDDAHHDDQGAEQEHCDPASRVERAGHRCFQDRMGVGFVLL